MERRKDVLYEPFSGALIIVASRREWNRSEGRRLRRIFLGGEFLVRFDEAGGVRCRRTYSSAGRHQPKKSSKFVLYRVAGSLVRFCTILACESGVGQMKV